MSTKNLNKTAKAGNAKPEMPLLKAFTAPKAMPNAFTAFVAEQRRATDKAQKDTSVAVAKTSTPDVGVAVQQAAKAGFTHTESNGRKDYTPHTIGKLIWETADTLQAVTPTTPVTSAAVRIALPHVKPASVSAGLSHWRKFNGTGRQKAVPTVVGPVGPLPPAAADFVGPPVPPWMARA